MLLSKQYIVISFRTFAIVILGRATIVWDGGALFARQLQRLACADFDRSLVRCRHFGINVVIAGAVKHGAS